MAKGTPSLLNIHRDVAFLHFMVVTITDSPLSSLVTVTVFLPSAIVTSFPPIHLEDTWGGGLDDRTGEGIRDLGIQRIDQELGESEYCHPFCD